MSAELEALKAAGAIGEYLGTFIDAQGRPLDVELARRTVAIDSRTLATHQTIAIAGGPGKAKAIEAALRGGRIGHLVTDERTAQALVEPVAVA